METNNARETLSKSEAGCFLLCPQKHYYSYILRYEPVDEPGQYSREFGIAFHEALAEYYRSGLLEPMLDKWNELTRTFPYEQSLKGEVLLLGWTVRFPFDDYDLVLIEVKSEIPVGPCKFVFIVDLLLRHKETGKYVVVDHKTTGSNIFYKSRFWAKLNNSLQARSYVLALQQEGIDINSIRFCVVRLPSEGMQKASEELEYYQRNSKYGKKGELKPGQRAEDETASEYQERLFDLIAANPSKYYGSQEFDFSSEELGRTQAELEILFGLTSNGVQIRNEQSCFAFNRPCEFYGVCWRGEELTDETLYQVRKPHE